MNPIRKSISDERAALNALVKSTQAKLAKLDQLAALADDLFPESTSTLSKVGTADLHAGNATVIAAGTVTTKKAAILDTAAQVLSDGVYRDSRSLLPEIEARGIKIGGNNPVNNLSAYMSAAKDRFESNRQKGGWMIKQPKKPRNVVGVTKDDLLQVKDELLN